MSLALVALKNNTMGVNQAAKNFKVPKATLLRRFRRTNMQMEVKFSLADHLIFQWKLKMNLLSIV